MLALHNSYGQEIGMTEEVADNTREIRNSIEAFSFAALLECASREDYIRLTHFGALHDVVQQISDDLIAFSNKDPASKFDPHLILRTYTSFPAVLHYRLAHWIDTQFCSGAANLFDPSLPAFLSKRGKMISGAEIHFKSKIGKRFILDHGFGTVIGETTTIGDDCYCLGGVVLGARGISGNTLEPRHPIIGNRVQIGSFASVFGRVKIGDDVFIGPNCMISEDIPSGANIRIKSSIQITYPQRTKVVVNA
jgi:serine O-acetyltransferase